MGRTACTEPQCLYKGDLYSSNTDLKVYDDSVYFQLLIVLFNEV